MAGTTQADVVASLGSRRDISDKMTIVDAASTPLFSLISKGASIDNMTFEYPINRRLAPKDSVTVDGDEVKAIENPNPDYALVQGRAQWNRRASGVTKLAQVQNQAGMGEKIGEAKAAELLALKQDIECTLGDWDRDSVAGDSLAAFKTRSIPKWIQATAQTDLPFSSKYLPPAAQIDATAMASFTESIIITVLQSIFNKRKAKGTYQLVCGTSLKEKFTDFRKTQNANSNTAARVITYNTTLSRTLENVVDVYVGDTGTLELVPSPWLAWTWGDTDASAYGQIRGVVLDTESWEIRAKQRPELMDLTNNGAGPRFQVDAIWGLAAKNPPIGAKFQATA